MAVGKIGIGHIQSPPRRPPKLFERTAMKQREIDRIVVRRAFQSLYQNRRLPSPKRIRQEREYRGKGKYVVDVPTEELMAQILRDSPPYGTVR